MHCLAIYNLVLIPGITVFPGTLHETKYFVSRLLVQSNKSKQILLKAQHTILEREYLILVWVGTEMERFKVKLRTITHPGL